MYETAYYYSRYYRKSLIGFWEHLGPSEYVTILIAVGVIGFIAMRSNLKR